MVQTEDRRHQPGGAGCAHQVPDVRLDCAEEDSLLRAEVAAVGCEHPLDLCPVGERRPGRVRLDELQGVRPVAGRGERAPDRTGLRAGTRCPDSIGAAVARRSDTPDHRVDPVLVTDGVFEPFRDQHARAFTQHEPVRGSVERPAARARKDADLAERDQDQRMEVRVTPSGHSQVELAGEQPLDRLVERGQR